MGTTVSISLYVSPSTVADAFVDLTTRLGATARVDRVRWFGKDDWPPTRELDPAEVRRDPLALARRIIPSENAVGLEYDYALPWERMHLMLRFTGHDHNYGWARKYDGALRFTFPLNPVVREVRTALRDEADIVTLAAAGERALQELERLFFWVCGLEEPTGRFLDGAVLYLEKSWRSGNFCAMQHFRDVSEYAREWECIYAYWHWGLAPQLVRAYPPGAIWSLSEAERASIRNVRVIPVVRNADDARGSVQDNPKVERGLFGETEVDFLDRLTPAAVRYLSSLPGETMRAGLVEAAQQHGRIRAYDLGPRGLVLSADPLSTLWPVYSFLLHTLYHPGHDED